MRFATSCHQAQKPPKVPTGKVGWPAIEVRKRGMKHECGVGDLGIIIKIAVVCLALFLCGGQALP